jgi:predicted MPP superfamily phosphohydrolase
MLFFFVFLTILVLLFIYLGRKIILPLNVKKSTKFLLWFILFIFPCCLLLSFSLRLNLPDHNIVDMFGWIGFIGMGFFSLVVVFFLLRDIILIFHSSMNYVQRRLGIKTKETTFDPQRRYFILQSVNFGILGASGLITGYGFHQARRKPILEKVNITLPNLPQDLEGFRIAQFTDLHIGPTIKRAFVESVTNQVNSLSADMIVFTGDLVDGTVESLNEDVAPLSDLSAPFGKFFVTGNHEYYSGVEPWLDEVDRLGMSILLNEHKSIIKGEGRINLAGVTDFTAGGFLPSHQSDPKKALNGAPPANVQILLAHQPRNVFEASDVGVDIQLSGHTHGGQYIPWSVLVTLAQPYISGLHKHNNTWIYVNRGTGYWGPPLRLGIPSEITLITLTSQV